MPKHRVHQAMSAKWPASTGSVRQPARARDLLNAVRPGNRLALGQLGHGQELHATGQTVVQKVILSVAVVATTLVSAALMVLASVVFDLGY
jgi:hypothetical protein